jgi:PKD repeat protein
MKRLLFGLWGIFVLGLLAPVFAQSQPIANAGPDRMAYTGMPVYLEGNYSPAIIQWWWSVTQTPNDAIWTLEPPYSVPPYTYSQNVSFTAFTPGDYVLALWVISYDSVNGPDYVTIHVANNLPPVAVAGATNSSQSLTTTFAISETVWLFSQGSYDPEGMPLTYLWDFGDSSANVTTYFASHVYDFSGTYTVTLIVYDELGASDTDVLTITVLPPDNNPPTASPAALPTSGTAPLVVQFTANAVDLDSDPLTYLWEFGDGTTSTDRDPFHTYNASSTFTAKLTVSDGTDSASYELTIAVNPAIKMTPQTLEVQMKGPKSSMGKVEAVAMVEMATPGPSQNISAYFDGILLFSVPFSSFETSPKSPLVYKFHAKDVFVELDMEKGQLSVIRRNLSLSGMDLANGADMEFRVGSWATTENVLLTEGPGNRFVYPPPVKIPK